MTALPPAVVTALDEVRHVDWEGTSHFTCSEAEAVADLLRALGESDTADSLIRSHSYGDDDCVADHHDGYLKAVGNESCDCGTWAVTSPDGNVLARFDTWERANEATSTGDYVDDAEVAFIANPDDNTAGE